MIVTSNEVAIFYKHIFTFSLLYDIIPVRSFAGNDRNQRATVYNLPIKERDQIINRSSRVPRQLTKEERIRENLQCAW